MYPQLLQSQFETLEEPSDVLTVVVTQPPERIIELIRRDLLGSQP